MKKILVLLMMCGKYIKFKNPKISIYKKASVLSIICSKRENKDEKIFK